MRINEIFCGQKNGYKRNKKGYIENIKIAEWFKFVQKKEYIVGSKYFSIEI